jgi:Bacterial PH domain
MKSIPGVVLANDEKVLLRLRPVIFAFGKYYELTGLYFLAAIVWMYATLYGGSGFTGPWYYELLAFWLVLVLPALGAGVLWISKQPLVYSIITGLVGTTLAAWTLTTTLTSPAILGIPSAMLAPANILPFALGTAAFIAFLFIQAYRRGHRYLITDRRIVLAKTFMGRTARELHYDKIADLIVTTSFWGRRLHYGTVIPISESGLGLGGDISGAAAGASVKTIKNITLAGAVFGGREIQMPRAATYYELYGIHRPERVHATISDQIHSYSQAPVLKRIEGLLRDQAQPKQQPLETKGTKSKKEQLA